MLHLLGKRGFESVHNSFSKCCEHSISHGVVPVCIDFCSKQSPRVSCALCYLVVSDGEAIKAHYVTSAFKLKRLDLLLVITPW